jgi:hypothetical protein
VGIRSRRGREKPGVAAEEFFREVDAVLRAGSHSKFVQSAGFRSS